MDFLENITFRNRKTQSQSMPRIRSSSINESSKSCNNLTLDGTSNSLPNLSDDENDKQISDLREEIAKLKLELSSAHQEIKNLSLENMELKKSLEDVNTKDEKGKKQVNIENNDETPHKNSAQDLCQKTWHNAYSSTKMQNSLSNVLQPTSQTLFEKNKLCIISSNKTNRILSTAEDTFDNYKICHYLTPNCSIEKLIDNLHSKLLNYTLKDSCIIFIGEDDFLKTSNYCDVVIHIREVLSKINNTNIILCLPTYKCNDYSMMYNWRIETFNNMLYMDNQNHHYAWLLDSNLELSYKEDMFSWYNGQLNNKGMLNIFQNLKILINEISYEWTDTNDVSSETPPDKTDEANLTTDNTDFFRF